MKLNGKNILLCDCEGTMDLDAKSLEKFFGGGKVPINTHLCRVQIANFTQALEGGEPVIVACTQEAPLFDETAIDTNAETPVSYTNIRERAGWSSEGGAAMPKIMALLAEATLDAPPATSVSLSSEGNILVYGEDESAIAIAKQLSPRLAVTCLIKSQPDMAPPRLMDVPIFFGKISTATGHLGAFQVTIDGYAPLQVSSRRGLEAGRETNGVELSFDLILNLTKEAPLFPAPEKRDGYYHPDPGNPGLVQKALFDATDMVGSFDKPRYIRYDAGLCVHARNRQVGCTRCIDECSTGAITPGDDQVVIDPYICAGCGSCASVCPTGAAKYEMPAGNFIFERLKLLMDTYREAGKKADNQAPSLLVHDTRDGEDMIGAMARFGNGLPAEVIPFAVNEVTQIGFDFFTVALAYGYARLYILTGPGNEGETNGLENQIELIDTVMAGLGHGSGRVSIIDDRDPDVVEAILFAKIALPAIAPGDFAPMGKKRTLIDLALTHLSDQAPEPVETIALPAGAPFGDIEVNTDGCTLCLSCVSACPTGALKENQDRPQFSFLENACVQCGLCRTMCPESVIALTPRLNFSAEAKSPRIIKEEDPFECVKCGAPFGTKSSIEAMFERLADHPMFSEGSDRERIKMCPDCRVMDQFDDRDTPMVLGARPHIRTTDDYLKERGDAGPGAEGDDFTAEGPAPGKNEIN